MLACWQLVNHIVALDRRAGAGNIALRLSLIPFYLVGEGYGCPSRGTIYHNLADSIERLFFSSHPFAPFSINSHSSNAAMSAKVSNMFVRLIPQRQPNGKSVNNNVCAYGRGFNPFDDARATIDICLDSQG
jgi:hypothetical protein